MIFLVSQAILTKIVIVFFIFMNCVFVIVFTDVCIQFVDMMLEPILFLNLHVNHNFVWSFICTCTWLLKSTCLYFFIFAYTCMVMYFHVSPFFCSQYCIYFVPSIIKQYQRPLKRLHVLFLYFPFKSIFLNCCISSIFVY